MPVFTYRGHLEPDSPLFRGRGTELHQLSRLWQGPINAYGIVYGGRRTEKTSLLLRLATLVTTPMYVCFIDCQERPRAVAASLYDYIARRVAETIPGAIQPCVNDEGSLISFLRLALKQASITRLILLIDEVGALPLDSRERLANVVRSMFTQRSTTYPELAKLLVVIAGGIELYDLAVTDVSTLQGVCEQVYLPDLSEAEGISIVNDGLIDLGVLAETAIVLAQTVNTHTQGHPYLTQRLSTFLEEAQGVHRVLTPLVVDHGIEAIMSDDVLLRHLYSGLRKWRLFTTARRVLERPIRFSRVAGDTSRLELLGLIRGTVGGHWCIRNPLLERVLREWLDEADSRAPT